ncbi:MAG: hypothetical protein LLF96_04385, partial [Eubacteriales bacterium]|nr:hypothetical protein [Eubacteriales bacterium]
PSATPSATATVTAAPTATVTVAATETVSMYVGYAVTTTQTALRKNASLNDQYIIITLPAGTLLYLNSQVTVTDILWSGAQTRLGTSYIGVVQDGAVKHITEEEAQVYIDAYNEANATPTPSPTPSPTPIPAQTTGYYIALGDVPMRSVANTYADILTWLPNDTVVYVAGQVYNEGYGWHITAYNDNVGYVRADQLRKLNNAETEEYLNTVTTVTPAASATPKPYDPYAASSYGYVTSSSVNFRSTPSASATRIKTLKQYAFALILGSRVVDGETWYNINQAGTVGWVDGRFFNVLNLTELSTFLNSSEYLTGLTNNSTSTTTSGSSGNATQGQVSSVEDWNVGVWENPSSALSTSYEPFNPYTTPTVAPTTTVVVGLNADGSTVAPTDTFVIGTMIPISYEEDTKETQTDNSWVGLAIGGVILLGGAGGVYAYALNQNKKRRLAARNAANSHRTTLQGGQTAAGVAAAASTAATTDPHTRRAVAAPPAGSVVGRQDESNASSQNNQKSNVRPAAPNPYARPAQTPGAQDASGITAERPASPGSNPYVQPKSTQSAVPSAPASPANPYRSVETDATAGTEQPNPSPRHSNRAGRYQNPNGDDKG